jgi:hypothetical protein
MKDKNMLNNIAVELDVDIPSLEDFSVKAVKSHMLTSG